ncbi:MAG: diguanylate cyclase [Thermodesulfobacteriota bacterium]
MKKFINSRISNKNIFRLTINCCSLSISTFSLVLILYSKLDTSKTVYIIMAQVVLLLLVYSSKNFYDKNGVLSFLEKAALSTVYIAFFEIMGEFLGRGFFSVFFILIPLIYMYIGRTMGIVSLLIVSAVEFTQAPELNTIYKTIPLAITTILFGTYISGAKNIKSIKETVMPDFLRNKFQYKPENKTSSNTNYIQKLIKESLSSLSELLPYNSIVLYIKNSEGLYEICEFISHDSDLIDRSQKLNFRSGYISWTVKTKTPFMIGNIRNPSENIPYYNREVSIQSLLIVPLLNNTIFDTDETRDQPNGILVIDCKTSDAFNNQHKLLATIISERINSLITIFSLQDVVTESSDKLNSIYKYIQKLESSMDINFILTNLLETLNNSIPSDLICITIKKGGESEIKFTGNTETSLTGKTFTHSQSLVGIVSENNTPLNLSDISERSKFRDVFNKEIDLGLGIKSIKTSLIIPLSATDEKIEEVIFGVVFIGSSNKEKFNEEQKNLAKILIQQAAKGIKYSINLKNVKELAIKDGLSGLYNQKHFKEMLSNSIAKAQRFSEKLSLILMDIDNFKEINDKYGHLAGDKIISEVGKVILNSLREIDLSARYGGDEFAVLLEKTDQPGARIAAEKIKNRFTNTPVKFNNENINVSFSMGIATYPENAASHERLIEKADLSLYEAKRNGKNMIIHFNETKDKNSSSKSIINFDKNISLKD